MHNHDHCRQLVYGERKPCLSILSMNDYQVLTTFLPCYRTVNWLNNVLNVWKISGNCIPPLSIKQGNTVKLYNVSCMSRRFFQPINHIYLEFLPLIFAYNLIKHFFLKCKDQHVPSQSTQPMFKRALDCRHQRGVKPHQHFYIHPFSEPT